MLWDHSKIGNNAVPDSMLELEVVKKSSEALPVILFSKLDDIYFGCFIPNK